MKSFLLVGALLASTTAVAQDFEYHGYLRSGMGWSRGGTDQVCFKAPGASSKARLGNECETYLEQTLTKNFFTGKDKSDAYFATNINVAMVSAAHQDWEATSASHDSTGKNVDQNLHVSLREAYAQGHHLFGKDSAAPWAGKRFYRRHDIHMFDFYLLDNTGPGAGVENIGAGVGKLHLAVLRNIPEAGDEKDGPAQTNVDVRLSDVGVGPGRLEAVLIQGASGKRGNYSGEEKWESLSGNHLALIYSYDLLGGFNKVVVQHGTGLFGGDAASRSSTLNNWGGGGSQNITKGDTDTRNARKKSSTLRVSDQLVTGGSTLSSEWALIYQNTSFGGAKDAGGDKIKDVTETTFGARPIYHLSKITSVALEYGYSNVSNIIPPAAGEDKWEAATLHKLTLAPQFTTNSSYWARPQIRFFATYASWNKEAEGYIGGGVYGKDNNGFSTGAQLEAWW